MSDLLLYYTHILQSQLAITLLFKLVRTVLYSTSSLWTHTLQALAWLLVPRLVEDLPTAANHFRKVRIRCTHEWAVPTTWPALYITLCLPPPVQQVQVYDMLTLLLSQQVEDQVWSALLSILYSPHYSSTLSHLPLPPPGTVQPSP